MITNMTNGYDHLANELDFTQNTIEESVQQQPGYYNCVCENTADALRAYRKMQLDVSTAESSTDIRIRKGFLLTGEKTTEASIKALVNTDPALYELKLKEIELEAAYTKWQG